MNTIKKIASLFVLGLVLVSFQRDEPKLDLIEKIYAQTDRSLYFPDETIWFKAYVVNTSNTISAMSEMMYVDLISPKGSVVKTLRLPISNGYSYGNVQINKNWVGGIYTLKMYTNWMRNYGNKSFFTKEITVQKVVKPNLLMTLEFAKEAYGPSSEVEANFEVKNLKNQPLANTKISLAVMVAGKSVYNKSMRTNDDGKLDAKFTLPKDLQSTDVLLNILIPYKGTTESISRSVPVILDNLDVQFFPESGKIIAGTKNVIAFKAINEFGKPADISGKLIDENGKHILDFDSFHDGMGGFEFEPVSGNSYYAQLTKPFVSEKKIRLPEVYKEGVRFSIESEKSKVRLSLYSTSSEKLKLKVSNETGELLLRDLKSEEKNIKINTTSFPIGITKFSIIDESGNILAERLVFINEHQQLDIDLQIEKEVYDTREKVVVKIQTKDTFGKPVSSNVSLAVADNKLLSFANDKQDHILSYLLVSSELRGKIHKPIFYFDEEEPKAQKALDYVLLTHGWRDYILKNKVSLFNAIYQPEQLAIQYGAVVDTAGNPRKAHLLLFDNYNKRVLDFETDEEGLFSFKLSKGNNFTLVAYTDDNAPIYIRSKNRSTGLSSNPDNKRGIPNENSIQGFFGVERPNQKPIAQEAKANVSLEEDQAALDEVVVTAYGTTTTKSATGSVVTIEANDFGFQGEFATQLQGKASGVSITEAASPAGAASKIVIRGATSMSGSSNPLIIVDGIPREFNGQIEISPDQIHSVSVLKNLAATTLYGSRGSNGVILISTKSQRNYTYNKKKLNNKKRQQYTSKEFYYYGGNSFDDSAKFYVPQYKGDHLPEERTDFRQTIYWNPVVQTNQNGEATLEFYNSDAVTSFKITAEGIGSNGLLGRKEKDYSTKKMLNLDFKSPNYMSMGDVVTLPLTITNESEEVLFSTLEFDLPENLQFAEAIDTTVNIAAQSTVLRNIKVIAKEKGTDLKIRVAIRSNTYKDVMHKKVTVLSPYFPIATSFSGTNSQSFEFDVNDVAPNSLSAEFTVYTDIVGSVMNGVEAMIRQPYGCFEQVSSATYPNVLVLKYLREKGKTKGRIERRAQKYIADGYRRMVAYETEEDGFEWYGNTPPHEALSAYGLMQFHEMKDVYEGVDPKMVQRTVNWLLSRKDTKGGFLQNKGKYGFSSAPANVNNAYIVYALTETKAKADIEKEYQTAYFNALDSLDTYKLALTALSSHNLNKIAEYENLLSYIKLNIRENGFEKLPVEHTITRSYGYAKNIETTAFVLLSLMRDYESNELLIAKGVDHLLKRRYYGGFGSTQSTAMALKVLIEYTKIQKQKVIAANDMITLELNGKVLQKKMSIAHSGKIRIDSLEKYLTQGKQKVSVKFSSEKAAFPYNMNINWDSPLPDTSEICKVGIKTELAEGTYHVGDIVRMKVEVRDKMKHGLPMATAMIGIPSGASVQPWQLKEILEQKKVAFYEIFDNYLVFYWRELGPQETKVINLDLKAEIAGNYTAPASTAYLYYGDEFKDWIKGASLTIYD